MAKQPIELVPVDFDPFGGVDTSREGSGHNLAPVDYDPFADSGPSEDTTQIRERLEGPQSTEPAPPRFTSFINATTQGLVDVPANAAKGLGLNEFQTNRGLNEAFDRIDNGEDVSSFRARVDLAKGLGLGSHQAQQLDAYRRMTPEQRAEWRGDSTRVPMDSPLDAPAYEFGQELAEDTRRIHPTNPEYQDEFLTEKLPRGIGSGMGFIGTTAITLPFGGPTAIVGTGLVGSQSEKAAMFEDAILNGATMDQALEASDWGAAIGTSEALPIAPLLSRLDRATGGEASRIVKDMLIQGTEEAIQEAGQSIMENLVARDLVAYDKERGIFEGTGEGAAAGFTIGVLFEALGSMVTGRHSKGVGGQQTDPAAVRSALDGSEQDQTEAERAKVIAEGINVLSDEEVQTAPEASPPLSAAQPLEDGPPVTVPPGAPMPDGTGERSAPVKAEIPVDVDIAAEQADTAPTDAQKMAGNYKKGHVKVQGLDIAIENPKGSVRSGTDEDGKAWETVMRSHYGYIKTAEGADGDKVDVFINTDTQDIGDLAFVVDQVVGDKFDEHKVVLGADSIAEAKAIYSENYAPDWNGIGEITPMHMDEFKAWLKDGNTKKPLAWKPVDEAAPLNDEIPDWGQPVSRETNQEQMQEAEPMWMGHLGSAVTYARDTKGKLTPKDLAKAARVSTPIAKRLLEHMAAQGIIRQGDKGYRRIPVRKGPVDLWTFLADRGGISDNEGHDLRKGRNLQRLIPGVGQFIRKNGLSMDYAREAAAEAGYPVGDTVATFLASLERGYKAVYIPEEAHQAEEGRVAAEGAGARSDARTRAAERGLDLDKAQLEHASDLAAAGYPVDEAIDAAIEAAAAVWTQETAPENDYIDVPWDDIMLMEPQDLGVLDRYYGPSISEQIQLAKEQNHEPRTTAEVSQADRGPVEDQQEPVAEAAAGWAETRQEPAQDRQPDQVAPAENAGVSDSGPTSVIHSTPEEIDALVAQHDKSDHDLIVQALGSEEAARDFERLDRKMNNVSNPAVADAASAEFNEKYGDLTDEQERLIYGVYQKGVLTVDDLKAVQQAIHDSEYGPEEANETIAREITWGLRGLNRKQVDAVMEGGGTGVEQANVIRMQRGFAELNSRGIDKSEFDDLLMSAMMSAGFSEGDAVDILSSFGMKPSATPKQNVPAINGPTTETVTNVQGATEQGVIPGAEKISDKELAERKMEGPKKAEVAQKDIGSDGGLFDSDARSQGDLLDVKTRGTKPLVDQKAENVSDKSEKEMFSVFNDPDWTGVAPGLDWKVQTRVVEIKKQYEDIKDPGAVRAKATSELTSKKDGLLGDWPNLDTGWDLRLYRKGIEKSLSGTGSKIRAALAWKLPDLLKHAVLVETVADKKNRADINRVHRFYAAAHMDGHVRRIKITVREHNDGVKRQYDIDHLDIEKPGTGLSPTSDGTTSGVASASLPGSVISIRQLLDGVNSEMDGKPVLARSESHAIIAEYNWKSSVDRQKLAERTIAISKRINPRTKVEVKDDAIVRNVPGHGPIEVSGVHSALKNLIEVSIDRNPEKAVRHEQIHALKSMGLFTEAELSITTNKAKRDWMDRYDIKGRYPTLTKEQQYEEAMAQAFAEYAYAKDHKQGRFAPNIRRIFDKIKKFFERLANVLRKMGYQSVDDIFDKVESGEVGARDIDELTRASATGEMYSTGYEQEATQAANGIAATSGRGRDRGPSTRQARGPEGDPGQNRSRQIREGKTEQIDGSRNGAVSDSGDKYSLFGEDFDMEDIAQRHAGEAVSELQKRSVLRNAHNSVKEFVTAPPVPHSKDLNWAAEAIVHPRTIAEIFPEFTGVWLAAEKQFKRRDTINADLTRRLEAYHKLSEVDKEQVHKVLEIGRLEGGAIDSPIVGVTNKLGDAQLTQKGDHIKLTKEQSEAYHAVRDAMDHALDLYKKQVLKEWGFGRPGDPATAKDLEAHAKELYQAANEATEAEEAREINREANSARHVAQLIAEIEQAKKNGYIPFSRFGNVSISVRDSLGGLVHFEKIEAGSAVGRIINRKKVQDVRRRLMKRYPKSEGYDVESPRQMVNANDLSAAGIKLSDVDALAELGRVEGPEWEAVREQLNEASKKVGFRKHFVGAKNTAGYSIDFERSIADYVTGISSYLARREVRDEMETSIASIPDKKANLKQYARDYDAYIQSPKETLQWLRSLNFFYYLSGNLSSATVNLSQVYLATMPYMTQFVGEARVSREFAKAYADAAKMVIRIPNMDGGAVEFFDPSKAPVDVREDLQKAWDDGTLVPLVTMEQMGVAHGSEKFRRGISKGTRASVEFAGSLFTGAERANRVVTFIAAHRIARQPGVMAKANEVLKDNALWQRQAKDMDATNFAEWVIDETHFVLGKRNRPRLFRGVGTAFFQFKGFTVNYLELMWRMARQNGPAGKKAFAYVLGALMASAGVWGLPFGDDLKDLLEAMYAWATDKEIDLESELREVLYDMSDSAIFAEVVNRGGLRLTGADMSHRLDMGNILPTDSILALFGKDTNRAAEVMGVSYDMLVSRPQRAIEHMKNDEPVHAAAQMLPQFAANPLKAYGWAVDGVKSRDRVAISKDEITNMDVALKAFGFTPVSVSRKREKQWATTRAQRAVTGLQGRFYTRLARALATGDKAEVGAIKSEIVKFNADRPVHERIIINPTHLKRLVLQEVHGYGARRVSKKARGRAAELEKIYPE